jgi:Subtilisin inhibitor-like
LRWPAARTSWRAPASVLAAGALLAACGGESGGDGGGSGGSDSPTTRIQVEYWSTAGSTPISATLTCGPPGGTHLRAKEACSALGQHSDSFAPVPEDVACTEIYGGPETATVSGILDGQRVQAQFNRSNGCEIARWDALAPLLQLSD